MGKSKTDYEKLMAQVQDGFEQAKVNATCWETKYIESVGDMENLESELAETRQALSEREAEARMFEKAAIKHQENASYINKRFDEMEKEHKARIAELEVILKQAYFHGSKANK